MEHIITRKKERKKETNKQTEIKGTKQDELEIKARLRFYLFLCVKKPYFFNNSSKPCTARDLRYVDKIILID
jgi:hypothetical protein